MRTAVLSLRSRILLWHGLLLACVLAAFGITAHRLYWAGELERIDSALDEPLSLLHRAMHARGGRPAEPPDRNRPPPDSYEMPAESEREFAARGWQFFVWSRSGAALARSSLMPEALPMPSRAGVMPFVIQRQTRGQWREAYLFTPPGECFLAAASLQKDRESAVRLAWWLVALGVGVLTAGLLVDAWILRRAIRPVEDIIGAAEMVSSGNLSARIEANVVEGTELGRLTAVLNRTFSNLDEAFSQQARFSADVAHELRTPVSVLIAEAQSALERQRGTEEYRETISTVLRSARRMSGLIESLLDLARVESRKDANRRQCDFAELCSETVASLRNLAETHGITVEATLASAPCEADAAQMTQVIANLLGNAIQHNERGGHVRITTGVEARGAFVRVENTGQPIPPADLANVFKRFYRTDSSRSRKTGGAGLGLAICKAIVDAHSGSVEVSSVPGEMTRFTVWLPSRLTGTRDATA